MNLVRMPAPFNISSWPPKVILSSSLTPATSAAKADSDAIQNVISKTELRIMILSLVFVCPRGRRTRASRETDRRQGAPERATGMYTNVHEDRERGVTQHAVRSRELDGFENSGGAHAGAHAHGDHAVLLLSPPHSVHDRRRADRAGRTQRMAKRDGPAQRVDLRRVEPEVADHGDALRSERLVQLDPVDLVLRDAGRAQDLRD